MRKGVTCYYQTQISDRYPAFQLAIETQAYWAVEDIVPDRTFGKRAYLLRFDSKALRDKFRKAHTDERILPPRSFAARFTGWTDVPYISVTKIPSVEEKYRTRKKGMTYKEAATDILEYLKGQGVWMYTPSTFKEAAIALDSRVKHTP